MIEAKTYEDVYKYIADLEAENKSLNEENAKLVEEKLGIYAKLLNENAELKQTYAEMKQVYDQLEKRIDAAEANTNSIIRIGADRIKAAEDEYKEVSYSGLWSKLDNMDDFLLIQELRSIHTAWYHERKIELIARTLEQRLGVK